LHFDRVEWQNDLVFTTLIAVSGGMFHKLVFLLVIKLFFIVRNHCFINLEGFKNL